MNVTKSKIPKNRIVQNTDTPDVICAEHIY